MGQSGEFEAIARKVPSSRRFAQFGGVMTIKWEKMCN
jgi:hypothetical protein